MFRQNYIFCLKNKNKIFKMESVEFELISGI